jgi:[ribosomal protein S5]-alanine N-acetyltransferase
MLESERLFILPLRTEQLELYLRGDGLFEKSLMLAASGRRVDPQVREMVTSQTLPKMRAALGDNGLFHTFWIVIDKSTKVIVAELGFKGEPNDAGEIEIGYGSMPSHRGKGYMTEAVSAMVGWAQTRSDIRIVLAETASQNIASQRILAKNNFHMFETKNDMTWWKIAVK